MDDTPVLTVLQDFVDGFDTQKLAAGHIIKPDGIPMTEQYLSDLLRGRRSIPEWLGERFDFQAKWIKVKK